jgi:hypothetical protein
MLYLGLLEIALEQPVEKVSREFVFVVDLLVELEVLVDQFLNLVVGHVVDLQPRRLRGSDKRLSWTKSIVIPISIEAPH